MYTDLILLWFSLGFISFVWTAFAVVRPSRRIAIHYFEEELGLHRDNVSYLNNIGTFFHYVAHMILTLITGPVFGFYATLSRSSAVRGYSKSLIRSGVESINEADKD